MFFDGNYDEIKAVNFSTLKYMNKSPKHYKWALNGGVQQTAAMAFGTAVHMAILEPEKFANQYFFSGLDRRTKAFAAVVEANPGKIILKTDEWDDILAIREAVMARAGEYFSRGAPETAVVWDDPATGIRCKGRLDFVKPGQLVGLKTTRDGIAPWLVSRTIAKYHYHAQWAMYLDGSETDSEVFEIFVEPYAPFDVAVYRVPESVIAAGRKLYQGWLARLADCRDSGRWPGIQPDIVDVELPAWAIHEEATELIIGGESHAI